MENEQSNKVWNAIEKQLYKDLIERQAEKKYEIKVAALKRAFKEEQIHLISQFNQLKIEKEELTKQLKNLKQLVLKQHYEFVNDNSNSETYELM